MLKTGKAESPAQRLRELLAGPDLLVMPCAFDALSAKLIEQAGFKLTFMSGFAAAASRIGAPDLGLMSYGEVVDHARNMCDATNIPVLGDGDTGYGNAMNVQRTVAGLAKAGCAAVMIEDQLAPKRCGHTPGKEVVRRDEAFDRIKAAVDVRAAQDLDILLIARTDAAHELGLDEALERAHEFHRLGAEILFVEAPQTVADMARVGAELPGHTMANLLEGGKTPELSHQELRDLGFKLAAYPLTLLSAAMKTMIDTLNLLSADQPRQDRLLEFAELRQRIGFDEYYEKSAAYASSARDQS